MGGPAVEPGGGAPAAASPPLPADGDGPGLIAWLALVAVYLAWGSTYVAIRVAVRDVPPLTLAGGRSLLAGALLWPVAIRSGGPALRLTDRPGLRQWAAAGLVGLLLLVGGNGAVTLAEQTVPAGLTALLIATVPLWMAVAGRVLFGVRVGRAGVAALAVGLAGVALLVRPGGGGRTGGMLLLLGAAAVWALGSVLAPRLPLPRRLLLTSAIEMLVGGAVLLVLAAAGGELGRLRSLSLSSGWAVAFLVVGGSLLGFTAYATVLARLPPAVAATYAYVNPLVAVGLGWALLGERLSRSDAFGAALVVVSVAVLVVARSGSRGRLGRALSKRTNRGREKRANSPHDP